MEPGGLLAVDVGLRTGLARFGRDGRLRTYLSRNFGTTERLRRGARRAFREMSPIARLALEGGGPLTEVWVKEADRNNVPVLRLHAEDWRKRLLLPRDRKSGKTAKSRAGDLARRVIEWSGARRPTSLRHDAAEAIAAGLFAVLELGWLPALPRELESARR